MSWLNDDFAVNAYYFVQNLTKMATSGSSAVSEMNTSKGPMNETNTQAKSSMYLRIFKLMNRWEIA